MLNIQQHFSSKSHRFVKLKSLHEEVLWIKLFCAWALYYSILSASEITATLVYIHPHKKTLGAEWQQLVQTADCIATSAIGRER